jgi:putative oxidoreductase
MTLVRRAARPMLASTFVVWGIDSLRDPGRRADSAEKVAPMVRKLVPQLPADTVTLVRINGAVQLAGGLALGAGIFPRLSAAALAVTLVPTTLARHRFWEESDPVMRRMQRQHFMKNLGLLGGLLLAAVDTAGKPGLAWRTRHAGEDLQRSVGRVKNRAQREATLAARAARKEAQLLTAETRARVAA